MTHVCARNIIQPQKRKQMLAHAPTLMNLEDIMVCEIKPVPERQVLYDSTSKQGPGVVKLRDRKEWGLLHRDKFSR